MSRYLDHALVQYRIMSRIAAHGSLSEIIQKNSQYPSTRITVDTRALPLIRAGPLLVDSAITGSGVDGSVLTSQI